MSNQACVFIITILGPSYFNFNLKYNDQNSDDFFRIYNLELNADYPGDTWYISPARLASRVRTGICITHPWADFLWPISPQLESTVGIVSV